MLMYKKINGFKFGLVASVLGVGTGATLAQAGFMLENSFFYDMNGITSTTTDSHSRAFESLFIGSSFGKGFFIGWNTNYSTRSQTLGTSGSTLTGIEMGPKIGSFIDAAGNFLIAFGINPLVRSTYTPVGGSPETWSGIGYQGELAYSSSIGSHSWIGIKVVYDSIMFSGKTNSSNLNSVINYSSPTISPSFYYSLRFE
jgi:hypothetical protein